MEFLGVGPLELGLIIVLALVLVGPRDMARLGREAGRFLNRLYHSPAWRTMNDASRELRNLPNRLAREAELDTLQHDLGEVGKGLQEVQSAAQSASEGMQAWTPTARPAPPAALPGQPAPLPSEVPGPEKAPDPPATESPFAEG